MAWYRVTKKQSGGGTQIGDLLALASAGTDANPVQFDMTDAVLHTQATAIPAQMFRSNKRVRSVSLANILTVGAEAFREAPNLNGIDLPSCTSLGASAFQQARSGLSAFMDNPVINLPACESMGDSAFLNIRTGSSSSNKITWVLTSLKTLGATCFRCNSYPWYTDLLYLPAIVTMGNLTFGNANIVTLKLGPNCTSVGNNMIQNANVTNLIIEALSPPAFGSGTSYLGTAPSHIYVPDGSVATYKGASGWSTYSNIIESIDNI